MVHRKALVLGATGGIGGEVARRLKANGWAIVALHRDAAKHAGAGGFDWRQGDAMAAAEVMAAAEGASLIVHAVNPPGYRDWGKLVLPMLGNTIAAARASGARVLLPGTVYNYGPDAFPVIDEAAPQNPVTVKGRIRAEMERCLREAAVTGVRTLIVRAGDFFGPRAGNNWFAQGLVKPGKPLAAISYPGAPGVGHQWAYLPDVAETMVRLVEKDGALEPFATFHMEGHRDEDGTQMIAAIRQASGRPNLPVRRFPWRLLTIASPFIPLFRELKEMRYLWQIPVRLTNARLVGMLGAEPRTPLEAAVRATLADMGCLKPPKAQPQRAKQG
jgi:nucleoside-diphosphate-sugar epimerase